MSLDVSSNCPSSLTFSHTYTFHTLHSALLCLYPLCVHTYPLQAIRRSAWVAYGIPLLVGPSSYTTAIVARKRELKERGSGRLKKNATSTSTYVKGCGVMIGAVSSQMKVGIRRTNRQPK